MNNTIQQLEANKKFEKLLNLFEEIAPGNEKVQKQISLLSNSKANYIKKLQTMWHSIQTPKFTELEIREICQGYFMDLERTNELRLVQGLEKIALVDSRNWVVKSEQNWSGWNPEEGAYYLEPLLYQGAVNYKKIFEPLTIADKSSGSINLIWTLQKFLKVGGKMGLSHDNWVSVWLTLAKDHMPNDFQALSRNSDNADALFIQLTASINSDNEISKIRTALGQISRKPTELLQSSLFKMLSYYTMLLSIEYPSMSKDEIHLKADHFAASSAVHLVSKNTALIINQFVALRQTEGEPISVVSVTNLVTSHEATNQNDKATTILYLPESCTRLDKLATQATNVTDLVLAASTLSLGDSKGHHRDRQSYSRSQSRDKQSYSRSNSRDKYQGRSRDRNPRGRYSRDQGERKKPSDGARKKSYDNKYRRRSSSNNKRSSSHDRRSSSQNRRYSDNNKRNSSYDRRSSHDKKHNPRRSTSGRNRYDNKSRSGSRVREKSPRNTGCLRCGMNHLSSSCKKYPFHTGEPCSVCQYMHDTRLHKGLRQNSTENRPKKTYSIPDHKYRDPPDGVFMTNVQKIDQSDENIFRIPKN
jgi:hypothetical protein